MILSIFDRVGTQPLNLKFPHEIKNRKCWELMQVKQLIELICSCTMSYIVSLFQARTFDADDLD